MQDILFILAQIFIFSSIVLIVFSVGNILSSKLESARRLEEKSGKGASPVEGLMSLTLEDKALKQYSRFLTPENEEKLSKIKENLIRGGYRKPQHVRIYNAVRIIVIIVAVFLGVFIFPIIMAGSQFYIILLVTLMTVMLGYFCPRFWLERNFQYRHLSAEEGFPDALDLILVCIEAGHGFDQALNRVVLEIKTTNSVLAEEFGVVVRELRAGKDRYKVLADFAWRTGVEDISSFITVIKQADKFGVSIAEALRVYSNEMRDKRYMRAEEKANMMPLKLAMGAIMFTVPPAMIVMVGPSIIQVVRHLTGSGV